jgi:hypothetical protein
MDDSSANLPVDALLAAFDLAFGYEYEQGEKNWQNSPEVEQHPARIYEKPGEAMQYALDKIPLNLQALCLAAKVSGTTHVRVTAKDFALLAGYFHRALQKPEGSN